MAANKQPTADDLRYWKYDDLVERGIITSREQLSKWQRDLGFPKSIAFHPGRSAGVVFRVDEILAWCQAKEDEDRARQSRRGIPGRKPPRQTAEQERLHRKPSPSTGRPRGRPRKVEAAHPAE